ncbi:MAG: hypothetical protein Q7S12_00315 [bacterium]|nr:hypothetical protein [bacterium]
MITSGSVGCIHLPEMTDEMIAEAMKRSGKQEVVVTEELLKKGSVLSVFNAKRAIYVRTWVAGGLLNVWDRQKNAFELREVPNHRNLVMRTLRASEENKAKTLDEMLQKRRMPKFLLNMIFPEANYSEWVETKNGVYYDRFYYAPKPDRYGLPWGKIEEFDHKESDRINSFFESPKIKELLKNGSDFGDTLIHYADLRALYELLEETGLNALRIRTDSEGNTLYLPDNKTPISDALFERLAHLFQYDRLDKEKAVDHEVFFFWIKEVIGKINEVGAEGETEAPEILPIMALTTRNFYKKHAYGIMILLDKLIKEYGEIEHSEPLLYLQQTFGHCDMLRKDPAITIPNLSSDAEIWAEVSKDFIPLK